MHIVLDLSNFDGELSSSTVATMVAAGLPAAIIGCQNESIAMQQVGALAAGGVPVLATYAFLYFGFDIKGEVDKAIRVAQVNGIKWVALDVEAMEPNEAPGQTPYRRVNQLRDAVAQVEAAGLNPLIYTGAWYWPSYMGNSTEFSHLPLWHSEYPDDEHEVRTVNYGGWTDVAIHQYTSTFDIAGRKRDANYVFDQRFLGEEEMGATPDDKLFSIQTSYKALAGGVGGDYDGLMKGWVANGNSLIKGYLALVDRVAALEASASAEAQFAHGLPDHTHVAGPVSK
jgi:hypothetical protein